MNWRLLGVGILVLLTLIASFSLYFAPFLAAAIWAWRWITGDAHDLTNDAISHLLALAFVAFVGSQFRAISNLLKRVTENTDEQIVGKWYIYRYGNKYCSQYWMASEWDIFRSITTGRYLIAQQRGTQQITVRGEIVYKERDRFNVLLTGRNHKQQSLVSFQLTIPSNRDPRMIGLGVGDDADYQLSTRVYLASRVPVPRDLAAAVIDDATSLLRSCKSDLLQLPITAIAEIFFRHPLPASDALESWHKRRFSFAGLVRWLSTHVRGHSGIFDKPDDPSDAGTNGSAPQRSK